MPCNNCNSSSSVATYSMTYLGGCTDCNDCSSGCLNTNCIFYTGPSLSCSGIDKDDTLETAIQKIDELLCSVAGEYGTYNMSCLDDELTITTEQQFVEAISDYVCTIRTDLDTFTATTFTDYQTTVDERFTAIEQPGITCTIAAVVDTDDIIAVLNKYCTAIDSLNIAIDISSVDWDQCLTVSTPPATVAEAFDLLVDQICTVRATANSAAVLPTFNNTTSCLDTPGASDSLEDTIIKIKDRLCLTPTFDNDNLTSSCVTIPATDTDLEGLLQNLLDKLDAIAALTPTFDSGDFSVTATDSGDACAGVTVALSTPIDQDRFVAIDGSDTSPGVLVDKIEAGDNIELDTTTTPGKMIISSTITDTNDKVKAFSGDGGAGFLEAKVEGQSFEGLSIVTSNNGSTGKIDFTPDIDWGTFVRSMMTAVNSDPTLKAEVCAFIASCGCNCGADDCTTYSVFNETGATVIAEYLSCVDGDTISVGILDGSTIEVCARTGTLVAAGCTITNLGDCAGGTTTTSTTTTTTTTATPLCKHYAIENQTGSAGTFDYVDCAGEAQTGVAIADGQTIELCAQEGSIVANSPLELITVFVADCTDGTTTTTTTTV